jgi:hypothetical protein
MKKTMVLYFLFNLDDSITISNSQNYALHNFERVKGVIFL